MRLTVFDIGGTRVKYATVDEDLNITEAGFVPTPDDEASMLDIIERVHRERKVPTEGIAISVSGYIDSANGLCYGGGVLAFNHTLELGKILEERCHCPVHLENDAKAATMAELAYGSLRGTRYSMACVIGTYVGGGFVFDGKVYKGRNFRAGEINVICIDPDNWESMDSTLGEQGSIRQMLKYYRERSGKEVTGEEFFSLLDNGDSDAEETLRYYSRRLAIQLMNVAVPLELERIAIGGGISRQERFIDCVREEMARLEETNPRIIYDVRVPLPDIVACTFYNESNLLGAYYSFVNNA